jgi:hypothetical protein
VSDGIFVRFSIRRRIRDRVKAGRGTRVVSDGTSRRRAERASTEADADPKDRRLAARVHGTLALFVCADPRLPVAHRDDPARPVRARPLPADLAAYVLPTVRGSDPRSPHLPTGGMASDRGAPQRLTRQRGLSSRGFRVHGWLPEHIAKSELRTGVLVLLYWKNANVHVFEPRLFWRV